MIATDTLCLIVWSNAHPEVLGHECTVIGHDRDGDRLWNIVTLRDERVGMGPDRCFLPLSPSRDELDRQLGKPLMEHFQR